MEINKCMLMRGSLAALLAAGSFCVFAHAVEETTSSDNSSRVPQTPAVLPEEEALPMRGVLNTFTHAFNDWYTSVYPHLQKFHNMNLNYLSQGGGTSKLPGMSGGSFYSVPPSFQQVSSVPAKGATSNFQQVSSVPAKGATSNTINPSSTVPYHRFGGATFSKPAISGTGGSAPENTEAQAALVTALNSFHQYVDNFINHLSAKLSPYLVHYTPMGFYQLFPTPFPVPVPPAVPGTPAYVVPPPQPPVCSPGDPYCAGVQANSRVPGGLPIVPSPSPAAEVDMSAIIELLGRFGGRLSPSHIVALQPFMEEYIEKLSADSKAALKPLLSQYWPQLFSSATDGAAHPAAPSQPATTSLPASGSPPESQGNTQ